MKVPSPDALEAAAYELRFVATSLRTQHELIDADLVALNRPPSEGAKALSDKAETLDDVADWLDHQRGVTPPERPRFDLVTRLQAMGVVRRDR